MKRSHICLVLFAFSGFLAAVSVPAQEPSNPAPPSPEQRERTWGGPEGQRPLFGKITTVHEGTLEISRPDGQAVIVKLTSHTEFRKDREKAKLSDFKVGDMVMVRGDENPDHSVTAKLVGGRSGGPGGGPGGPFMLGGTLGKDFVVGEVKSIDAPRITVLRPDNVTQTLELNEETSLHKGRESITMADIHVGDHVMARGAAQNDVFVPKGLMVMSPEQWTRFQQFAAQNSGDKPTNLESAPVKP